MITRSLFAACLLLLAGCAAELQDADRQRCDAQTEPSRRKQCVLMLIEQQRAKDKR